MDAPTILKTKTGWLVRGPGWAVAGTTQEEALAEFRRAEERRRAILARPDIKGAPREG